MRSGRAQTLVILGAMLAAAATFTVPDAKRALAWGWKEDEGTGGKPRQRPRKDGWGPSVQTPPAKPAHTQLKAEEASAPKVEEAAAPKAEEAPKSVPAPEAPPTVKTYCENIADQALDARFIAQKAELARLEGELAKRTAQLEAKKAEYQEWLKRRDEFINKVEDSLVKLYTKIKPDAAAPQLSAMEEDAAAALLMRLSAKTSGAILDQMEAGKAAKLVSIVMGAAKADDRPAKPAAPATASALPEGPKEAAEPRNTGNKS
jgi:flagellar motility protein MotE (MotC chaperone)